MEKLFKKFFLYFTFLWAFTITVEAQEDINFDIGSLKLTKKCAPEIISHRDAIIAYEELTGVWFQMPVARCMLNRLKLLPKLQEHVILLEHRRDASDELILVQQSMVNLSQKAQKEAENALMSAVREKQKAEEERDHWTRSPWLWVGVGTVGTLGLTVLAIWTLDAVANK